jgi:hypothetical protein
MVSGFAAPATINYPGLPNKNAFAELGLTAPAPPLTFEVSPDGIADTLDVLS